MTNAITVLVNRVEVAAKATLRFINTIMTGAAIAVGVIPTMNALSAKSVDHDLNIINGTKPMRRLVPRI